jgi:CHASE3 domain sensor protein
MSLAEQRIAAGKRCLAALGKRYREDSSDFDGRTLRDQLRDVSRIMSSDEPESEAAGFVAEQREANHPVMPT